MKILFASSNEHKLAEIRAKILEAYDLISLKDIGFEGDIPETSETIEGNAIQKAEYLSKELDLPTFADDTGLIIPALHGEPGVFSARYAGPQRNANDNMDLVLEKLEGKTDRSAYFLTAIALHIEGKTHLFEGRVDGQIIHEKRGNEGFGYDPIFLPNGYEHTFAEMSQAEKNQLSHRARALEKMLQFLAKLAV